MSVYYNFYVGIRNKETEKLEHFPGLTYKDTESKKERAHQILYRSRSFLPDGALDYFNPVNLDDLDDALKNTFTCEGWNGELANSDPHMITLSDLRSLSMDYIKRGYFLVEDVAAYEKRNGDYDLDDSFYDVVSATVYANMCAKNIQTTIEKDVEGFEYVKHGWADYMYYAYPDIECKEYLFNELNTLGSSYEEMLSTIYGWEESKKYEIVILQDWS